MIKYQLDTPSSVICYEVWHYGKNVNNKRFKQRMGKFHSLDMASLYAESLLGWHNIHAVDPNYRITIKKAYSSPKGIFNDDSWATHHVIEKYKEEMVKNG